MPKYYKKKYYRGSRDKYSVEQTVFDVSLVAGQTSVVNVVPGTSLEGMRKVKHLTINAANETANTVGVIWALFYLPAGMAPPAFATTTGAPLIEPNQFVLNCGVFDNQAGPIRISSPVSRNLNSGDSIILLLRPMSATAPSNLVGVVRYAITLN